jgi:hypothetical protein
LQNDPIKVSVKNKMAHTKTIDDLISENKNLQARVSELEKFFICPRLAFKWNVIADECDDLTIQIRLPLPTKTIQAEMKMNRLDFENLSTPQREEMEDMLALEIAKSHYNLK